MNIKPIRTPEDLAAALARVDQLWGAEIGSPAGDELEILALLIEKYEDEHFPMPPSDPVEAIKFRMDQMGLTGHRVSFSSKRGSTPRAAILRLIKSVTQPRH